MKLEIIRFLCALPLAQMNLKAPMVGSVTASDASEFGGGFCVSRGLSPMGACASHCSIRGDLPELEDHVQVLTVGLFDGVGALRVAADCLLLPMAGHVSSEVSREGSRVVEAHFPDSILVGKVENIDDGMVKDCTLLLLSGRVLLLLTRTLTARSTPSPTLQEGASQGELFHKVLANLGMLIFSLPF